MQALPFGADDQDQWPPIIERRVQRGRVATEAHDPEAEVLQRIGRLGQVRDPRVT